MSRLSFANGSALPTAVGPFSTSVAVVIVATDIAVIDAARKPAASSAVKPIANTSKLLKARPTTAIGSGITANAGLQKKA